jgi:hypothetical protein
METVATKHPTRNVAALVSGLEDQFGGAGTLRAGIDAITGSHERGHGFLVGG